MTRVEEDGGVRIRFVRHATFVLYVGGISVLVDPMLNLAGAVDPVPETPNQRRNPLVGLPFDEGELGRLLERVDAVLVTHTHQDHWDARAVESIPEDTPIICQPEDEASIAGAGFSTVFPVASELWWRNVHFTRTGGRHGTGEIGRKMGPVSGFVVRAAGTPSTYVAGDTIWCPEVEEALSKHEPAVTVVNAGAAQFLTGGPITMTAEDVGNVCCALPSTRVVAVHMEALNHCLLTQYELHESLRREGISARVEIPPDGALIEDPTRSLEDSC